ncbi:MAG: FkbM family methyltransferase [Pyrinomonadaceae bacterium]
MKNFLNAVRHRKSLFHNKFESADFTQVERAERIFYLEYLRDGMTVFDVGANIGELTLLFSRFVGENGKVHSFEASRAAFQKLETICRAANKRNVILNHLALADKQGLIRLHVYDDNYLSFNTQAVRKIEEYGAAVEPVEIEETTAETVDDYCEKNGIGQIDLLKIDVEGAELQVLRGARKMLQSGRIKCLTFEFGQATFDMGNTSEEIRDCLKESGYKFRNMVKGDPVFPGSKNTRNAGFSMHVATPASK